MANREHLLLLLRSVTTGDCRIWNNWRIDHPSFLPLLAASELFLVNLPYINLSRSDLKLANLSDANLHHANLKDSDLRMAGLKNTNLRKANLQNSNLRRANLTGADLRGANLRGADLWQADLSGALLKNANLTGAILDPYTLKKLENLCEGCVTRLERIALRLSKFRQSNSPAGTTAS